MMGCDVASSLCCCDVIRVVGSVGVESSRATEGLPASATREVILGLAGLRGDDVALGMDETLDGVGRLDSLAVAVWLGRPLGTVRLGDAAMDLGVAALGRAFSGGLDRSTAGWSCVRTE